MSTTSSIQSGSTRALIRIAFPLMLSGLSMTGMWFVDRLFLARYSLESLNAVAAASGFVWAFIFGVEHLTSMGQVFVARLNGAQRTDKLGEPVWQMLWYSLFSIPFFLLLGLYAGPLFFSGTELAEGKIEYFSYQMYIGPLICLQASLFGFFTGQGKTAVVGILSVMGNLINVVLDPLFIFGWEGVIPSMGIKGAVLATGIGLLSSVIVLFILFLRPANRQKKGSGRWRLQPAMLGECVYLGAPLALFVFFECLGWGVLYSMMDRMGQDYLLVTATNQSLILLFLFFGIGLEQAGSAVAGNLIGANKADEIYHLFRSGLKLVAGFLFLLVILTLFFGPQAVQLLLDQPGAIEGDSGLLNMSHAHRTELAAIVVMNLMGCAIHLGIEKVHWLSNGILRAAGDSRFIMLAGIISVWGFMVLPAYLALFHWGIPLHSIWMLFVFYSLVTTSIGTWRIFSGRWTASIQKGLTLTH